jgi:hypothetical protein
MMAIDRRDRQVKCNLVKKAFLTFLAVPFLTVTMVRIARADDVKAIASAAAVNNIQISIRTKNGEAEIKTNQSFTIIIRIRNNSTNGAFHFYQPLTTVNDYPISFKITSPLGEDVSPIPPYVEHGSGANITVLPKSTYQYEIDSSWFGRFDKIGTYKILGSMYVGEKDRSDWAASNPLLLTVVPGLWKDTNAPNRNLP